MKSISAITLIALAATIIPTAHVSRSISAQVTVPPPTCPEDITQPCGPTTDSSSRSIQIGT